MHPKSSTPVRLRVTQRESWVFFFLLTFLTPFSPALAQKAEQLLYDGNKAYNGGRTEEAILLYRKAMEAKKQNYKKVNFNLGAAIYKEAMTIKNAHSTTPIMGMKPDSLANIMLEEAAGQFEVVANGVANKDTAQKAFHNLGNARLMLKNYQAAVDAYKKALKIDPKDEDTRYNYSYALKKLKEQQKNQQQNQQQQQQQQQQQRDKQDIKNKKDQQQQAPPPQMSKEEAERMLNALKNNEQKMQQMRKKDPAQRNTIEKDW